MWQVWLIISGICFILEIMTIGFLVFWFAIGALITSFVSLFTSNIIIQTTVFILSSTALIFLTKPFVNKFSSSDKIQTNAYSIIGKKAIVIKEINSKEVIGQIKIGSEIWSAKSKKDTQTIQEGTEVIISEINGVKAIVEPILTPITK